MIFREVVQGLYKGSYVPGQRLVETDLTQRWGVSRGTVREALNRLAAEGIVSLSRHRGASIRILDRSEMQDIVAVMEMVIGMAARLSARRINEGVNRSVFLDSFNALQAFMGKPESFELLKARNRYFKTMALIGGNRELQKLLQTMHVHVLRVQLRAVHENFVTERFADYALMADVILAGDSRRAELVARRHIRATAAAVDKLPDDYPRKLSE